MITLDDKTNSSVKDRDALNQTFSMPLSDLFLEAFPKITI